MTEAQEGPCQPWIDWDDLSDVCTPPGSITDPVLQAQILASATRTLWRRSCQQFGLCTITRARVLPLCCHAYTWRAGWGYYPTRGWGGCGCGGYEFLPIDLGVAPVASVQGVWIDGDALDPANYRVDDWRRLVRTDGNTWGPTTLQPDQGGDVTIEVSWTYGLTPPPDGKLMAALLACKKAGQIADTCAPSANATQINREGVTIVLNAPDGDTGIVLVEEWLGNFQCGGGGIFDPGAHRATARVNT